MRQQAECTLDLPVQQRLGAMARARACVGVVARACGVRGWVTRVGSAARHTPAGGLGGGCRGVWECRVVTATQSRHSQSQSNPRHQHEASLGTTATGFEPREAGHSARAPGPARRTPVFGASCRGGHAATRSHTRATCQIRKRKKKQKQIRRTFARGRPAPASASTRAAKITHAHTRAAGVGMTCPLSASRGSGHAGRAHWLPDAEEPLGVARLRPTVHNSRTCT